MKALIPILFFLSFQTFAQNKDIALKTRFECYKYLDTINTYSKSFPTKLIEGSGTIKSKSKKIIGSIGFETEISRNHDGKLVRILNSEIHFFKKNKKIPAKTISYQTTIYFDQNEKPEIAKFINEELIDNKIITSKKILLDVNEIDFKKMKLDFYETKINDLLLQVKD